MFALNVMPNAMLQQWLHGAAFVFEAMRMNLRATVRRSIVRCFYADLGAKTALAHATVTQGGVNDGNGLPARVKRDPRCGALSP
jgi:hypothetical protein